MIDVDDTLCLTEAVSFVMENEALKRMGRPPMSREVHLRTWGQTMLDALAERSPGADPAEFQRLHEQVIAEFVADGRLDTISEANYRALDELLARGKKLMLLTSRAHHEFKHLLAPDHGLAGRITAFYYRDNMAFHKPDPRAFDKLLQDNDLRPGECLYVGDSTGDAQAANQAGLHFIANLESGLRQRADFRGFQVDAFIGTFADVVPAVAALERSLQAA